jgi:hypothetical protein
MFTRILLAAWILYLSSVALVFCFPKAMLRVLLPLGFRYHLPILILISAAYALIRLYDRGIKNVGGAGGPGKES